MNETQKKWSEVFPVIQVLSLKERSQTLIAGTSRGTLRSDDQGASWQWVHQEGSLHYTHWVGDHIVEMYVSGELYISEDKGDSWFKATYSPSVGSYVYEVVQVGDRWVMSNNYGIHQSMDAGRSWELIFPTETMGFFDFLVMGNTLYGGTRAWDEYRKRTE